MFYFKKNKYFQYLKACFWRTSVKLGDVVIEGNDFYEKELKGWGIEHFSSVLLGKDVKKLLLAIDQVLEEVLSCDVYNRSSFGVVRARKFRLK